MAHINPIVDDGKLEALVKFINQQFHSRVVTEGKKRDRDFGITLDIKVVQKALWITFSSKSESHSVTVPIPHTEDGAIVIFQNEVKRAVCGYYFKNIKQEVSYLDIMCSIICGEPDGVISQNFVKGTPFLQRVINSFQYGNTATLVYNLQRAINEIVNKLPLHETSLNSWVMNRRLCIIDPDFDEINDPAEKLEYQVEKNRQYFHKGWTSIGMSDGSLADKNYILTTDIRKLTPFSLAHNNPGRNLYSTLGMKGDELPAIRSESMQKLMEQGVTRKGWNFTTLFVDVPEVFEDQILVDKSHADKYVEYTRRYQCFGQVVVKKGDRLKRGEILSIAKDGEEKKFDLDAPHAKVHKVSKGITNVGGTETEVHNIIVTYRRYFKDGTKFTNLHGNKGVIKMKDLGYANNPATGHRVKIDVVSASTSIKKRKNFGQIIEAIKSNTHTRPHEGAAATREKMNRLRGIKPKYDQRALVFNDHYQCTNQDLERELEANGFPKDGTWKCDTHFGELKGVVGKVFWGVIAQPEGSLWNRGATTKKNGRELRTAGLKFSTVEFRALTTRFGNDNPILDEIMSYAQGTEDLHEKINILKSKRGQPPEGKPIVNVIDIKWVNQMDGTIMEKSVVSGTVVDETFHPGGFILQMPVAYQVAVPSDESKDACEGGVREVFPYENMKNVYRFNQIYIPDSTLRKCWRHATGKYGLSEIGALVNNMVICGNRLANSPTDAPAYTLFYQSIYAYFNRIASMMGSKRGDISTYGMAVRYPYSAKAYATVCNRLPKNTIEIHRNMGRDLRVKNGDIVLVERFPCLGFMSVRPQKIHITDDPNCKYTIRVSDNSLGSLSLDFDGDVLFIASFHTPEAKLALRKESKNPNKSCYDVIKLLNKKAGVPHTKCMNLQDYQIHPFVPLDTETHAELVRRATGVKSHTGPVIALAYNLMRLIENSSVKDNQKTNVAIELFLDKVGNSVFKQKHGVKSLHDVVIDAICTCNIDLLVEHGFERGTSTIICNIIMEKAKGIGVNDLARYHEEAKKKKRSNIVNRLVREQNKIYFASRAIQEGCRLLEHLEQPVVDIPSKMFAWVTSGKANDIVTPFDTHQQEKAMQALHTGQAKDVCKVLCELLDEILVKTVKPEVKPVSTSAATTRQKMNAFRKKKTAKPKAKRMDAGAIRQKMNDLRRRWK